MKKSLLIILILCISFKMFAQQEPLVAVLPFEATGVSVNEAKVVTTMFETALVQTGEFTIIEQTDMAAILDTQAISLSGCTDESCAVEIGKLLSAEQIVLGEFSSIGSQYVINAKILDVENGKNLKAENVTFSDLDELKEQVTLLGYMIAGLTYSGGGSAEIAKAFGDVFIETEPSDAEIYINGTLRGNSPELFDKIPVGEVLIEARIGNLYASRMVTVSLEMAMVSLELELSQGNLFIKSSSKDVDVFIGGSNIGEFGSGLFKDLPVGTYKLELISDTEYWTDTIEITQGGTTRVDAYPRTVGTLSYNLPEGAVLNIAGRGMNQTDLTGSGRLAYTATGTYTATVSGEIYETLTTDFEITAGRTYTFRPELEYTLEYLTREKRDYLSSLLAEGQASLAALQAGNDPRSISGQIENIADEFKTASDSDFDFPELNQNLSSLVSDYESSIDAHDLSMEKADLERQITESEMELAELKQALETYRRKHAFRKKISIPLLGIGGGGLALGGASMVLGDIALDNYNSATDSPTTMEYRDQAEMWDALMVTGAVAGVTGLIAGLINFFSKDQSPVMEQRIAAASADLAGLKSDYALLGVK